MNSKLSKLGYLLISLILAILLAAYVNGQHDNSITRNAQNVSKPNDVNGEGMLGLVPTKKVTVSVPLQLNGINTDDYYVSGAPESVKIILSGSSALVTSAQNTKNFQVYANLKNLTEGSHSVKLKVSGLSSDLTYSIQPKVVDVNIAKRAVSNYTVQTKFDDQAIADGYQAGRPTSTVHNVQVMGTADAVQSVQSVIASVKIPRDTKKDIHQDVTLQAVNASGKPVDVGISPQVTTVNLPVHSGAGKRQVPVKVKIKNGNLADYQLKMNVNEVEINGKMKDIEKIKSIHIPIDVSNIHTKQVLTVKVPTQKNVKVEPSKVKVQVTPKEQN